MSMTIGRSASAESLVPVGEVEDKELVLSFKRGEDGSYQAIYERYAPRVSGICRRILDQPQDAEEATQETFMRVYTSLAKFNGRYQLGAWVARIATNVCLDQIRSKGRKPADSVDHETLAALSTDAAQNEPEEELLKGAERQKVRDVLATLAPTHRAALALREFEGMSYEDIALALNMTESQVKALIHRARKAFKKQWAPGLAVLLPWRLIARVRRFSQHYDAPPQVGEAAASSMHLASSCSMALQHCGQFVSERVVVAVTALALGTAAVAGPAPVTEERPVKSSHVASRPQHDEVQGTKIRRPAQRKPKSVRPAVVPTPSDAEPEAAPRPAAAPTTPPEESSPTPAATPVAPPRQESPEPATTHAPFTAALGWDRGKAVLPSQPRSNAVTLDCTAKRLTQHLESVIHDGDMSFPARLALELNTGANLNLYVQKGDREVQYHGSAATVSVEGSGRSTVWSARGSYSAVGNEDPRESGLPLSGTFSLRFGLDCIGSTPTSEQLTLTPS